MKNWIKKIFGITDLEKENEQLKNAISSQQAMLNSHKKFVSQRIADLKEYTRVDADVGFRGNNTIVLTGVYRGKGFVRFYDLGDGEFEALARQLKDMKDHALVRLIDAPPQFHGIFEI